VLEDVVHRDDVVPSDMTGEVGGLQGAFEDVVSSGPALGRDVRLDLDARALQIEEPTELVEVPAVAGADVEDAARPILDQSAVEPGPRPSPELHQEPGDTTVVLVVGVVVARIEGGSSDSKGRGFRNSDPQSRTSAYEVAGRVTKYSRSATSVRYSQVWSEPQIGQRTGPVAPALNLEPDRNAVPRPGGGSICWSFIRLIG
jgi:hypothetical protein